MAVHKDRLREQLGTLRNAGYQCLPLDQALEDLIHRNDMRPGFVLTFDDGYSSVLDPGLAILDEFDMTATLFVTVDFLDGKVEPPWGSTHPALVREYSDQRVHFRPLTWPQLREIASSGRVTIGSHSMSHRLIGTLGTNDICKELRDSKHILEDRLGMEVPFFSYPFGVRRYGAYSTSSEEQVRAVGYRASLTSEIGRVAPGASPYLLPRIALDNGDHGIDACAKARGAYDWVRLAQRTFQMIFPNPHKVNP